MLAQKALQFRRLYAAEGRFTYRIVAGPGPYGPRAHMGWGPYRPGAHVGPYGPNIILKLMRLRPWFEIHVLILLEIALP